ncbi:hypothetical protein GGS21DRAFT_490725 [Xylaria nigripes]|nr:hypothetical protein GGS21DRAFT_490725 [Xylaria nigripes]
MSDLCPSSGAFSASHTAMKAQSLSFCPHCGISLAMTAEYQSVEALIINDYDDSFTIGRSTFVPRQRSRPIDHRTAADKNAQGPRCLPPPTLVPRIKHEDTPSATTQCSSFLEAARVSNQAIEKSIKSTQSDSGSAQFFKFTIEISTTNWLVDDNHYLPIASYVPNSKKVISYYNASFKAAPIAGVQDWWERYGRLNFQRAHPDLQPRLGDKVVSFYYKLDNAKSPMDLPYEISQASTIRALWNGCHKVTSYNNSEHRGIYVTYKNISHIERFDDIEAHNNTNTLLDDKDNKRGKSVIKHEKREESASIIKQEDICSHIIKRRASASMSPGSDSFRHKNPHRNAESDIEEEDLPTLEAFVEKSKGKAGKASASCASGTGAVSVLSEDNHDACSDLEDEPVRVSLRKNKATKKKRYGDD